MFNKGVPSLAMNANKEPGSNIFDVMEGLRATVERVNAGRLAPLGLKLESVYDETEYIDSAIVLVRQSLLIGGLLAIVVLLVYLRSGTSTFVIAVAIPISIIGAFLALLTTGRTLNVVSLAGLAFAVGMVVDNSIVVLENIYRHRQMGKSRRAAAFDGANEVWGAVLASTLTTIAVFLPLLFMKEEVGQLFGDIAMAISFAVALSLVIAITVIPALSSRMLGGARRKEQDSAKADGDGKTRCGACWPRPAAATIQGRDRGPGLPDHRIRDRSAGRHRRVPGRRPGRFLAADAQDRVPAGRQQQLRLRDPAAAARLQPGGDGELRAGLRGRRPRAEAWSHEPGSPEAEALPGGGVRECFYVARTNMAFVGGRANDARRARELIPQFIEVGAGIPGSIFVMQQQSLFVRGIGGGRAIDIEITGPGSGAADRPRRRGLRPGDGGAARRPGPIRSPVSISATPRSVS